MSEKRDVRLDLIRSVAVFSVLSVHFFLNNGFYDTIVAGKRMYIMVMMRTAFMVCVPLFLLLTGYLCGNKKLTRTYYRGIRHTLELYVLISIMCLFFHRFYLHETFSPAEGFFRILSFSASTYGWYMEMYIGLFLLIPFLNILYHGLESQKKKQALLITCLILTTLPTAVNIYDWLTPGFWTNPATAVNLYQIVPDWWTFFYPITFYFLGAYIREYDIHISVKRNIALFLICLLIFGSFNFYRNYGACFGWSSFVGWCSFENVIDSVLLFTLILHLDFHRCPKPIASTIKKISQLSLGIYLASSMSDKVIYPILNSRVPEMTMRLNYYPAVVLCSFLCALIISQLTQWLLIPVDHGINYILKQMSLHRKAHISPDGSKK